jgi:hypothetical protein
MRRPDARSLAGMTIGDCVRKREKQSPRTLRAAGSRIFRMMMSSDYFAGPANKKFKL